jgi:hypothetical protein
MHQLKEADMMSTKLDLIMKKLAEWDIEKKEGMHINDSRMTCEECGDVGPETTVRQFKKMWTTSSTTTTVIVLNQIKDGISRIKDGINNNKGQTTKVTFKVIILVIIISHPWEI